MRTTTLKSGPAVPPWQKPTAVIRVLRRPRPEPKRASGPAVDEPPSKWTVLAAVVLSVVLHIAPVAIVEMKIDAPPVEVTQALSNDPIPTTVD
jgi:hypothetical protein